ncbi:unnamed protein product [Cylicostephanus goldi]|uniref:DNA polymerase epsilon subunit B N-terminal domain-containing protein n=1 Tax=Cylicostephanus goldi TaxID=71465 RepID=A0A3P6QN31_CYLGO|nr:unnamed protein product [Cylicostephanus goldi]
MEEQAQKLVDATARAFTGGNTTKAMGKPLAMGAPMMPAMMGRTPIMSAPVAGMRGAMPPFGFPAAMPPFGVPMGMPPIRPPGPFRSGPGGSLGSSEKNKSGKKLPQRLVPYLSMGDEEKGRLRREIASSFRINAFEPKKEVLNTCVEALSKYDKEKRQKWMNKILETLRKQSRTFSSRHFLRRRLFSGRGHLL